MVGAGVQGERLFFSIMRSWPKEEDVPAAGRTGVQTGVGNGMWGCGELMATAAAKTKSARHTVARTGVLGQEAVHTGPW